MLEIENSPFSEVMDKIVNDEVDLESDSGIDEIFDDILKASFKAMEQDQRKPNRQFPKGGKIITDEEDILGGIFGKNEGREPIPESESDNCQCPGCRARRRMGIPKPKL